MKIAAVVIWFNPEEKMVENIQTLLSHLSKIIIVDNSKYSNLALLKNYSKIEYISQGKNIGIAAALNVGYKRAEEQGFEWILTMDQDSSFKDSDLKHYLDPRANHFSQTDVAIFGPNFEGPLSYELIDCKSVITSGSLVSLAAHKKISGYNEKLFIDQVDHEFCFRLKKINYRILMVGYICMSHTIGAPLIKKRFGRTFVSYNHSATRKYYITRNSLYMRHNYKEFGNMHMKLILNDIFNVIFVEDNKFEKLKSISKGFLDYFKGKMGPINQDI